MKCLCLKTHSRLLPPFWVACELVGITWKLPRHFGRLSSTAFREMESPEGGCPFLTPLGANEEPDAREDLYMYMLTSQLQENVSTKDMYGEFKHSYTCCGRTSLRTKWDLCVNPTIYRAMPCHWLLPRGDSFEPKALSQTASLGAQLLRVQLQRGLPIQSGDRFVNSPTTGGSGVGYRLGGWFEGNQKQKHSLWAGVSVFDTRSYVHL